MTEFAVLCIALYLLDGPQKLDDIRQKMRVIGAYDGDSLFDFTIQVYVSKGHMRFDGQCQTVTLTDDGRGFLTRQTALRFVAEQMAKLGSVSA